ncbi:ribonuclease Y [candidate division WOR-3 bacterium RBG_13_43_14]|uniref:Ribonuclease Y n=1 Tax=candidate division WOR-3 bacterium RBG_13_43_14 TaxID=1802590 RepID=A0A1F4U444_UNCW3|nr:MAG: ribonuclease Y [candidate division WOR-3 bacterium RBG_13_43_14]
MTIGLIISFGVLFIAVVFGIYIYDRFGKTRLAQASLEAARIIEESKREASNHIKSAEISAKENWYQEKMKFERETAAKRKEMEKAEKRQSEKEMVFERREHLIVDREKEFINKEHDLQNKERIIHAKSERLDQMIGEQNEALQKIANLSKDEAMNMLKRNLEAEARHEAAVMINQIKEEAKTKAENAAREITLQVIQRCATSHTAETAISVVSIPSDEMKGRIIGREGRNIRSFENLTGVEVIIDDTPETISLSCFDPIRREVARLAMEKLIIDGRIHPSRIEEVIKDSRTELDQVVKNTGEEVILEMGIIGVSPELVMYLGKMKYRTSYGQNLLQHSKEVAALSALLAQELQLNPSLARRAGLLHDLGKVADGNVEGSHAHAGAEIAKKHGENDIVINAIGAHHEEIAPTSSYAVIVEIADSISGSRPGARRETIEAYIKRLNTLEEIASSFDGVERVFAIQAGREVRVMVQPDKISDIEAENLAQEIARRIEKETQYPGQIKITLIREKRVVEMAK